MNSTLKNPGVPLAALALRQGLVTAREVREALAEQSREVAVGKTARNIGVILLAKGVLSEDALVKLLSDSKIMAEPETVEKPTTEACPLYRWGQRIGKYVLIGELGRGTAGVTYEAHDSVLGRRVALKVFDRERAALSRQDEERFVREARLLASLPPHPHIVGVHDAGCEDGRRYIAMDLLRGQNFAQWRREGAPLWKSVALLRDIARAIHHAHQHGVLHRDLKPENIMVDSAGMPHIMDFGLAKNLLGKDPTLTGTGFVVGTPAYMAPEQAKGIREVDGRCDVYSLGVMLYEILTGQLPFVGKSPVETLLKAIDEDIRRPSAVLRAGQPLSVDGSIEKICLRALAKNPDKRYATALEFADDLQVWVTGEKAGSTAPSAKKHRLGFLLGTLIALTLLAAGSFWVRTSSGTPVPAAAGAAPDLVNAKGSP